jgi:hypothetical protein
MSATTSLLPAAGHRLQAAGVAAPARRVRGRHPYVADVSRRTLRAPVQPAAGDDAAADASAHLDEDQVIGFRPRGPVLAESHDVHVVVDEDGSAQPRAQPLRHGEAVPAGHDRRVRRPSRGVLDRPWQADPHPAHLHRVAARRGEQLVEGVHDGAERALGPLVDGQLQGPLREHGHAEVEHGQAGMRGAEVGRQHDPRSPVEGEHRGGPAP